MSPRRARSWRIVGESLPYSGAVTPAEPPSPRSRQAHGAIKPAEPRIELRFLDDIFRDRIASTLT